MLENNVSCNIVAFIRMEIEEDRITKTTMSVEEIYIGSMRFKSIKIRYLSKMWRVMIDEMSHNIKGRQCLNMYT